MSSTESINGGNGGGGGGGGGGEDRELADAHVVELIAASTAGSSSDEISEEQIIPLLAPSEKPKINIFSVSYPRRKPNREQGTKLAETETSPFTQLFMWAWSGSRYSGVICMVLSSTIYCIMEVLSDTFSGVCWISLSFALFWRTKMGSGKNHFRNKSYLAGKVENCRNRRSCLQFLWRALHFPANAYYTRYRTGWLAKAAEASDSYVKGGHHIYAVLMGLFSSITGGISYCLIRAGAKASDQPVVTVFSFGILASPASVICTFAFEDFVLPGLYSFFLMVTIGILAFFAEVFLARGFQLEKTSKVANIQFIEAALSQLWGMGSSTIAPSFGRLVGCSLILISACCTMYIGPEKDIE